MEPLAACLFDERSHNVSPELGDSFCLQIQSALSRRAKSPLPEEPPRGCLDEDLARWCEELAQQNHRAQRQSLHLFALATPLPLLGRWASWWSDVRKLLAEARELKALPYDRLRRQDLRDRLEAQKGSAPPVLSSHHFLTALRQAANPEAGRTVPLARALALLPEEAGGERPGLFVYWSFLGHGEGIPESRVAAMLAGFERYLADATPPPPALLLPWSGADVYSPFRAYVESELMGPRRPRTQILAAYEFLATMATRHGGLGPVAAINAVRLFLMADDPELAARLFHSLHAAGRAEIHSAFRAGIRLCRDRPDRFAEVVEALDEQYDQLMEPLRQWPESLFESLRSGDLGETVRELIVTRQPARLLVCATKSIVLAAAGIDPPGLASGGTASASWMERYPEQLHPAIHRLAALQEDAEARVARWLADDFPDPERLRREIGVLETRLQEVDEASAPPLRKRLETLKERLTSPAAPGPVRLQRLRGKLERAWGRAVLDRWEGSLDERLPDALRRLFGIEEAPAWLKEPLPLSLLAAATRLRGNHRALAYRLFRLRCEPPPWDLRDAPENRAFLAERPEIDWRPWIDGVGTLAVQAANGRQLELTLEDDPLEIFRMGGHFQTCLSPGSINYFSVFANAADVNKRVLYARDEAGKVVGRCLLALTARTQLLVFEPYCHDTGAGFGQICADFAGELARRMGTRTTARGKVPALVASDWYDDGPRDLGGRFTMIEEGSPLRRRLATILPGELLDELRRGLKPSPLNEVTLPLVLQLPEIAQRPELAVPLLRPLAECRPLPEEAMMTASRLALRAGSADLVRHLFLRPLTALLRRDYRSDAAEVLLALDPGRLLAAIRQTRDKWVHDWNDEIFGERLEHAAAALEALHRPRQARALWQRLATSDEVFFTAEQRQRAQAALEGRTA